MFCESCRFDYGSLPTGEIAGALRRFPPGFRECLGGVDEKLAATRPEAGVWSALEYTAHVRDVLLVQRDRAVRTLVEDRPSFARMHRDERVGLCGYRDQPVARVLDQLEMANDLLLLVVDRLDDAAWSRPLRYNWPSSGEQDLAWMGRHTVHECMHHLHDTTSVLDRVSPLR